MIYLVPRKATLFLSPFYYIQKQQQSEKNHQSAYIDLLISVLSLLSQELSSVKEYILTEGNKN